MERVTGRDERFERMFALYQQPVRRYCLRRLPLNDVNDAVSEIFVVTWRRIDDSPAPEAALPWLYGVARNVVANSLRSKRRSKSLLDKMKGVRVEAAESPEAQVVRRARDQEVIDALGELRASDRELLQLKIWEELTNTEIGKSLGITPNAVAVRLSRARNRLARKLQMEPEKTLRTTPVLEREEAS